MKINHIKLRRPVDVVYDEQKDKVADDWCRHLKGIAEGSIYDHKADEEITITICSQCEIQLSEEDLEERQRRLKNFKR